MVSQARFDAQGEQYQKAIRDLEIANLRITALQEQIVAHLEDPVPMPRFIHHKTEGLYEKIGEGRLQAFWPISDMAALVFYRAVRDGSLWARPTLEFGERFTPIDG